MILPRGDLRGRCFTLWHFAGFLPSPFPCRAPKGRCFTSEASGFKLHRSSYHTLSSEVYGVTRFSTSTSCLLPRHLFRNVCFCPARVASTPQYHAPCQMCMGTPSRTIASERHYKSPRHLLQRLRLVWWKLVYSGYRTSSSHPRGYHTASRKRL